MTSIDGLFAILEDRGLMPAVALFSLSAVLGLLYLSSGNLKAPNPHLRQDVDTLGNCCPCGVPMRDGGIIAPPISTSRSCFSTPRPPRTWWDGTCW